MNLNLTQKLKNEITSLGNKDENWWRDAAIYQIYPRSFKDSNGDGIGDLNGITEKLDYIATLGVDAIWLSPFFTSPMKDFGYDVSNYKEVDPLFGTIEDFNKMLNKAHQLGIRVIIDQVLSHTSIEHNWFKTSRKDKTNDKRDWYIWADAKEDGSVPNNWLSIFGGSAWQWDPRTKQYYMHNFLAQQPDLNFHNLDVQEALLKEVEFWLKLGVDGFRLDTVNFFVHDKLLRNNPKRDKNQGKTGDVDESNPYSMQNHIYDKTRPENIAFLKKFRKLLDKYPGSTSVGEIGAADKSLDIMAEYTKDNDKMHMCYTFDFLGDFFTPLYFKQCIEKFEKIVTDGWACWSFSNHDVKRHISRWPQTDLHNKEFSILCINLLISLKGSICLYQGEELGFRESQIEFEDLQDPFGVEFWPEYKGRDGCRTPMAWNSKLQNGGFSNSSKTWLPIDKNHINNAAENQINDKDSLFNIYKKLLLLRKRYKALTQGSIKIVYADDSLLKIKRYTKGEEILIIFNFTKETKKITYNLKDNYVINTDFSYNTAVLNNEIQLKEYACCFMIRE